MTLTFNQLILSFQFSKFFPIYKSMSVQSDVVDCDKLFGTPEGPESGRFRFADSRGAVVGNVAHASFRLLFRSGKDDKQLLLLLSWQAALVTNYCTSVTILFLFAKVASMVGVLRGDLGRHVLHILPVFSIHLK